MDNGRIIWVTFYLKKAPKGALSFIRMECHRRNSVVAEVDAAAVVAVVAVAAVAGPGSAAALVRAG